MASTNVKNGAVNTDEPVRMKINFSRGTWGDYFLNFTFDTELAEKHDKETEALKNEVKIMLTTPDAKMVDMIDLIDKLERLGLSYHFENDIEQNLEWLFGLNTNYEDATYDLCTVSTHFRIFRQHGYHITSDIFSKFKDDEGKFKESLKSDVKGLMELHEAAHMRIRGENILEDALVFAKESLESMAPNLTSSLKKQVEHALLQSLHLGYRRCEVRHYISIYEEDEFKNESLLMFAKLDYNAVQMLHQQELAEVTRWWIELDLASKLPYERDRIVESFFWAMGACDLRRDSRARVMLAKVTQFLAVIDDTYDIYGTIEELGVFTDAIQRWDIGEIFRLPEYMKPIYTAVLKLFEGFREELAKVQERSFTVDYTINAFKELILKGYFVESKSFSEGCIPPFSKYIITGRKTSTFLYLPLVSLMAMSYATKEDYEWLIKKPRMIEAAEEAVRLLDDIVSYEHEKERGQPFSGIDCYMKEYGVTMDEARDKILEMVTNAWKDVNENLLMPCPCSREALLTIFNLTKVIDVIYKYDVDGYTFPERVVNSHIVALYIEPIKI